jgi:hypothetical protein
MLALLRVPDDQNRAPIARRSGTLGLRAKSLEKATGSWNLLWRCVFFWSMTILL